MSKQIVEVTDKNKQKFKKYHGICNACKMDTLVCDGYLYYINNDKFYKGNWGALCRTCRAYRSEQSENYNSEEEIAHILKRDKQLVEKINTHIEKPTPKPTPKPKAKAKKYIQDLFIDDD